MQEEEELAKQTYVGPAVRVTGRVVTVDTQESAEKTLFFPPPGSKEFKQIPLNEYDKYEVPPNILISQILPPINGVPTRLTAEDLVNLSGEKKTRKRAKRNPNEPVQFEHELKLVGIEKYGKALENILMPIDDPPRSNEPYTVTLKELRDIMDKYKVLKGNNIPMKQQRKNTCHDFVPMKQFRPLIRVAAQAAVDHDTYLRSFHMLFTIFCMIIYGDDGRDRGPLEVRNFIVTWKRLYEITAMAVVDKAGEPVWNGSSRVFKSLLEYPERIARIYQQVMELYDNEQSKEAASKKLLS